MVLKALAEAKKSELGEEREKHQETRFPSVGEEENNHKRGKTLSLIIPK